MNNNYKIIFPTTLDSIEDIYNDYLDVNIKFDDGTTYYCTLVTLKFIDNQLKKDNYFWIEDMVIINNLELNTIKETILKIIDTYNIDDVFCRINYSKEDAIKFNNIICELN